MSWGVQKVGLSDRIAAAIKKEMESAIGGDNYPGHLQEPEKTIAKMAMNLVDAALGEIKPPFFVRVEASGSMSRTGSTEKQDFREVHSLAINIQPFWEYVE